MLTMSAAIDLSGLVETMGIDREGIMQIIDTYICESETLVQDLELQLANQNFDAVKPLAHNLYESSALVGAHSLKTLAMELEQLASKNNPNKMVGTFRNIKKLFPETVETLKLLHQMMAQ